MARLIPVKYSRRESTLPFDDDWYADAFVEDDVLLLLNVGGSGGMVVAWYDDTDRWDGGDMARNARLLAVNASSLELISDDPSRLVVL